MDSFINGFCKVEFLCYLGEPNWLGWLILVPLYFFVLIAVYGTILSFFYLGYMKVVECKDIAQKDDATLWHKIQYPLMVLGTLYIYILFGGFGILFTDWLFELMGFNLVGTP